MESSLPGLSDKAHFLPKSMRQPPGVSDSWGSQALWGQNLGFYLYRYVVPSHSVRMAVCCLWKWGKCCSLVSVLRAGFSLAHISSAPYSGPLWRRVRRSHGILFPVYIASHNAAHWLSSLLTSCPRYVAVWPLGCVVSRPAHRALIC